LQPRKSKEQLDVEHRLFEIIDRLARNDLPVEQLDDAIVQAIKVDSFDNSWAVLRHWYVLLLPMIIPMNSSLSHLALHNNRE